MFFPYDFMTQVLGNRWSSPRNPTWCTSDQVYMAVCFWYLCFQCFQCTLLYSSVILCVTFYKVPKQPGHIYLVRLYKYFVLTLFVSFIEFFSVIPSHLFSISHDIGYKKKKIFIKRWCKKYNNINCVYLYE